MLSANNESLHWNPLILTIMAHKKMPLSACLDQDRRIFLKNRKQGFTKLGFRVDYMPLSDSAEVVELVDALGSGPSVH